MRGVRNLIIALVFSLVMPVAAFGNGISCSDQATLRSTATGRPAIITFVNNSRHAANIYWIDYAGKRAQHFYVTPGSVISRNSLVTHPWVITDDYNNCIGVAFANPSTPNVEITDSGIVFSRPSGPVLADNPYAAAGISDPAHVTQFLARLKQAVAANDRSTVAAMVNYPLTVNSSGGRSMTYRDAAALRANYARVFTPEVRAAVAAAKADDLFTRDQGVMIGNGEVWMNEIRGSMKIITVNHTQ